MIDLHLHTYYSDGRFSPAEVIAAAQQRGLSTLAICDHDNLRGSREAAPLAQAAGIRLIPAIELTTRWPGVNLPPQDANVDLLGYFVDPGDAVFAAFTTAALNDLHQRIADCCAALTRQGYPLALADVFAINPRYAGAVQLMDAILQKGYAPDGSQAAKMMENVWVSARETPFTIRAAIEQVHLAGGAAVLAHPTIVRPGGRWLTAAHLRGLVTAGLDGIEIYHHRLNAEARAYFLKLAGQFGLLVSGGSDMHGWARGLDELGSQPVSEEMVARLHERAQMYSHPTQQS